MKKLIMLAVLALTACGQAITTHTEGEIMTGQKNLTIDYIEFPATNMAATKAFYTEAFGWDFTDYGPAYAAFARDQAGIDGGFTLETGTQTPGLLAVLYANDLEATVELVKKAGGEITKEIFSFPGGRRFHFTDPSGNELAVWSDRGPE